jgi:hypothetical protein
LVVGSDSKLMELADHYASVANATAAEKMHFYMKSLTKVDICAAAFYNILEAYTKPPRSRSCQKLQHRTTAQHRSSKK